MRHPARGRFCLRNIRQAVRSHPQVERVTLLASFSPEQAFCLRGPFRYPLRGSEDANLRRQRLASQIPIRFAHDTTLAGMSGDVFAELLHEERMYDAGLVV